MYLDFVLFPLLSFAREGFEIEKWKMGRGLFTFTVRIFAQEESIENDNRESRREEDCTI